MGNQIEPMGELDQPTVALRLSPRATASVADDGPGETGRTVDDEPTVALLRAPAPSTNGEPVENTGVSLQMAAGFVHEFEAVPHRVLVRAAAPLFLAISQLRCSIERADVASLRRQVANAIDNFEDDARKAGIETGDIIAARYVLCATVDETVLTTPWGSRSEWSASSLLNQYHNETWGGEKVFAILDRIRGKAAEKLPLLILIYTCLMLGFEGRFRVMDDGRSQLEDLQNEVWREIRKNTTIRLDEPLSKSAVGERRGRMPGSFLPVWMFCLFGIAILSLVYLFASFELAVTAKPLAERMNALIQELAGSR
jgi:type VI secretion system protein ImpK